MPKYNYSSSLDDAGDNYLDYMTIYTSLGPLTGKYKLDEDKKGYYAFKKIPYAKFPGLDEEKNENRRFLDPSKLDKLQIDTSAPLPLPKKPNYVEAKLGETAGVPKQFVRNSCEHKFISEDQLFVNIYTRKVIFDRIDPHLLKPVLVFIPTTQSYIHPGYTKTDFYNPEYLMRKNIVVVVVSYRSGILGFLDTDSPKHGRVGNAGLKDIASALEWVQENIFHFSGDKSNVTLCGQGFGAALVNFCLLNKKTHHLYHRVIMQSGCALNCWAFNQDEHNERMKEKLLKEHTFEELQTMKLEDLLSRAQNHNELPFINERTLPLFGPTIEDQHDGAFLTAHPLEIMESEDFTFEHPVIIGYNSLEGLPLVTEEMMSPAENLVMNFVGLSNRKRHRVAFEHLMKHYGIPPSFRRLDIATDKMRNWVEFITDAFYLRAIRATALKLSEKNPNVYFYKFCGDTEWNVVKDLYPKWAGVTGAAHGDELGYIFKLPMAPLLNLEKATPTIMNLWANFIEIGDPNDMAENIPGYLGWPLYDKERETYLVFEQNYEEEDAVQSKIRIAYKPEKYRMEYWDENVTKNCLSHLTIPDFLAGGTREVK